MKEKYWLCKRGRVFYLLDSETGHRASLRTTDRNEAERLAAAKKETRGKPALGLALAKAYASALDPLMPKRKWTDVMAEFCKRGKPQTQACRRRITGYHAFDPIRRKLLLETTAEDFFAVLRGGGVMADAYLRCLHNLAQGLGWLPWPIIQPKLWPKARTKPKRVITANEHQRIVAAEKNIERRIYYELLWEVGAAQSDGACLRAENIDWTRQVLAYQRMKTGEWCYLSIGNRLAALLKKRPALGPLFPKMSQLSDRDRAAEFRRRCRLLKIEGVSLHSYRYAWANFTLVCALSTTAIQTR